jgi:two-component system response regulator ChvI
MDTPMIDTKMRESVLDAGIAAPPRHRPIDVVLIDDNREFVEALAENLGDAGMAVRWFTDGECGLVHLKGGAACDVILLDWHMPRLSGATFLARLRELGNTTPVIVLTGNDSEAVEDVALGYGAIDFIDKSRRASILLKRLHLIVRGVKSDATPPGNREVLIGALTLRSRSRRVAWKGREVGLTFTEFRIVELLTTPVGTDRTYREIYDVVHGEGFVAGDGDGGYRVNVRSLIKRIRQKFRAVDPHFSAIENYPGNGYRWIAGNGVVAPDNSSHHSGQVGGAFRNRTDESISPSVTA